MVVQRPYDDLVRIDGDALPVQICAVHPHGLDDGPLDHPAGIAVGMRDTGGTTQSVRTGRCLAGVPIGRRAESLGRPLHDETPGLPQFDFACHTRTLSTAPISGFSIHHLRGRPCRS